MFEKFYPDLMLDGIWDIDLDSLREKGIKGLILDIDNTLVPQHRKEADENAVKWIERAKKAGFKMCIVSNASKSRVLKFNDSVRALAVHRACKPGTRSFEKAARLMGIKLCESAVVGDQVFTDIYGGNRAGAFTILVKPIDRKEFIFVRLKRIPERLVLRSYRKSTGGS